MPYAGDGAAIEGTKARARDLSAGPKVAVLHGGISLTMEILQKAILDSANLAIIATDANGVFPLTIET